ncbi:Ethionine resistance-conferring protein 1 [Candida viswanathii]|uniref:Ethionine resistance-conferring protein 1 n=1 Tax=Candida viswanathii TaxID=5486 RepID=A0A367XRR9_9ASCO|nr:Ethionine resistance-conferring protein 1 [Candida viswanathii]
MSESEVSPLLPLVSRSESIDENEIIQYVQHRRQSIAASIISNDNFPKTFNFQHSIPPTTPPMSPQLGRTVSNISSKSHNIQDIISNHPLTLAPEPKTSTYTECTKILKYSIPLIITFLLQYSLTVASVFSVGNLGSNELAAISLSSMTANISGYAIIQGVSTCLDTLCAQSYGRKDYNSVGVHFVRCTYLLLLLYIPMGILWMWGSYPLLMSIIGDGTGESEKMCRLASQYLQVLSIGVPGFIMFENGKHYLQSQGIFHASTIVLCVCAPMNALLNYMLVWDKSIGLGFIGAPISVVITNWVMCISLFAYIFFVNGHQCWPKEKLTNRIFFTNWKKMINLSIPGVLMIEAEWFAFEIITLEAARFGTETLAAQSIISTTCVIFYQIPFALSIAAGTRIAWYIGAASKNSAQITTKATIYTSLALGLLNCLLLFSFRGMLVRLYTTDKVVIELAKKVLVIGAIYQINDCLSCATAGALRGQGRQMIGGVMNLIGYYVIALPFAFVFAFVLDFELFGLWMGMLIALMFVSLSQLFFVLTSNWDKIIQDCIEEGIVEDGNLNIEAHSMLPSMSNSVVV